MFFLSPFGIIGQETIPDEILIDYSAINKNLREVLFDLSDVASVTIAFQEEIIPGDSLINFSVRSQELGVVLDYLLSRHHVKYKIIGEQLGLYKDKYFASRKNLSVSGYLTDKESGEALISAFIYLPEESNLGTETNEYGYYSFTIPKGIQHIYYSYLGYNLEIKELALKYDTILNVALSNNILLKEVVITDSRIDKQKEPQLSVGPTETLAIDKISSKLPVAGEPDVMRLAYTLAGVSSGADGFGGMSVRGGSTNQNLILYDGVPVYNANQLFGMFSIFNSDVIKSAKLFKGPFPSHYSGRLSSVLDIRTRDGNNQKFGGNVSVGLLTAKMSLEGPIQKGRSSFLVSARRSTIDMWLGTFNRYSSDDIKTTATDINFYDFNAKLNFSIGQNSKLHLSYYTGRDKFENKITTDTTNSVTSQTVEDLDELEWSSGNRLASIKWHTSIGAKLFVNATLYKSNYTFSSFDHDRVTISNGGTISVGGKFDSSTYTGGFYNTDISDLGARLDIDYSASPRHSLKLGASYIDHTFLPKFNYSTSDNSILNSAEDILTASVLNEARTSANLQGTEVEFYIEDNIKFGPYTVLNLGFNQMILSASGGENDNKKYFVAQPRILFKTGSKNYIFKMSWGRMGQYLHSLVNTGVGVPSDIWLPTTTVLKPETSWIVSMDHHLYSRNRSLWGLEFYYKKLSNVTRYGTGILDISSGLADWESRIPLGRGTAYGTELSFKKDVGIINLDLAYTLAWSNRYFEDINFGEKVRYRYDRRHVLNASLLFTINENIEFSANYELGSGMPIQIPTDTKYNYIDAEGNKSEVDVDNINPTFDELPVYKRFDVGFNFTSKYKWGESKLTLGVYNVFGRRNPLYIDEIALSRSETKFESFYLFEIMPTISYNISF